MLPFAFLPPNDSSKLEKDVKHFISFCIIFSNEKHKQSSYAASVVRVRHNKNKANKILELLLNFVHK